MTTRDILRVSGLTKRFGGVVAVSDLSFRVGEGDIYGLIGPNGSGKSTTLHLLSGFLHPNGGTIEILGRAARAHVHERAQAGVGRAFQAPAIFEDLTVRENLLAGCHAYAPRGTTIFDLVFRPRASRETASQLRAWCNELLDLVELSAIADAKTSSLAYGQRKLLDLARAIASKPKLLLLDEPAAGLSSDRLSHLADIIRKLREYGTSIILAEHNMKLVMSLCTRIVVLNFGAKIADDVPASIQKNRTVIEAYLGAGHKA